MNRKTPPAYVAHRSVIFVLVSAVALLIGFMIADMIPGVTTSVMNAVNSVREAWQRMDWELF